MLKIGDLAPKFEIEDIFGNEVSVSETYEWTYISFHRFASCPFCVLRTRELINAYSLFEQNNIQIISLWPSSKSNMLKYVGQELPPFPLVADSKKEVFQKYHVSKSSALSVFKLLANPKIILKALKGRFKNIDVDADPTLLPAEFLISPKGEIVISYYGKHFGDHQSISLVINSTK